MSAMEDRPSLPRLRPWPVIAAIGIFASVMVLDGAGVSLGIRFFGKPIFAATPWKVLYFGHTGMLIGSLVWIRFLSRGQFSSFGFRAPKRGYMRVALFFGVVFGVVMTFADYWHNLVFSQLERPWVRKRVDAIQPLYVGDGLLDIHGVFEGTADSNSAISAASTTSLVAISSVSLRIACECENKIRSSPSCRLSNAIRCSTE